MICSVSRVNGTCGKAKLGNPSGRLPMSPTVWTARPRPMPIALSTRMATRGGGAAVVQRGNREMHDTARETVETAYQHPPNRLRNDGGERPMSRWSAKDKEK